MTPTGLTAPELDAYDDGVNYLVWCGWCLRWHLHGRGDGHRSEHCPRGFDSPYLATGYVLRLVGPWTDAVEAQHTADVQRGERARRTWMRRRYASRMSWAEAVASV